MKKLSAFVMLGACAFVVHMSVKQNYFYNESNKVIESIQDNLGMTSQEDKNSKETVENAISFVKNIKSESKSYQEQFNELNVYIRQKSTWLDSMSSILLSSLIKFSNDEQSKDEYYEKFMIAEGQSSFFKPTLFIDENNNYKVINPILTIGTESFKNKNYLFMKDLSEAFDNQKEKSIEFVVFHELGHYLTAVMKGHEKNIEFNLMKQWFAKFEDQKEEIINDKEKDIILDQYAETVGDIFAIQMMLEKYPEYRKNINFLDQLVFARLNIKDDTNHFTSPAILLFKESLKVNPYQPQSIEQILEKARYYGLKNVEFMSNKKIKDKILLIRDKQKIKLTKNGLNDSEDKNIRDEMHNILEKRQNISLRK